jgi:alpha-D-xyloside xylohydrolase
MLKKICLLAALTSLYTLSWCQTFTKTDYGIFARAGKINIKLQVYTPSVIRVIKSPDNITDLTSMSVVLHPGKVVFKVKNHNHEVILTTSNLTVIVNLENGALTYYNEQGKVLMSEQPQATHFEADSSAGINIYRISQSFILPENSAIYGLGQHQEGIMNYRNHTVELKQRNTEIAIPFMITSDSNGLLWDNTSVSTFTDKRGITTFESVIAKAIDYYFIAGRSSDMVIADLHKLTGKAPMFPKWVFGFWQSRERYTSQAELLDVVKKYRELKVPLDGIVQDWQYWGKDYNTWSSTEFGNPSFPDPQKMIDSVHQMNAHIMISVWPNFGNKTAIYKEMESNGLLYGFKTWPTTPDVKVYDAFSPKARDIYWKYLNKNLFSLGIDGWWLDATEPEQGNTQQSDSVQTNNGFFKSVRNAYPLVTTQGVYEHQRNTSSKKRVFILTRSAFTGQQRNATATWSGDIQSSWQVFKNQISGGLNLGLSGIPYWNTDIGGFFTAKYPLGVHDDAFKELYTRWFQFAAFTPLFRSHGTGTPREIYQFGKKGDWAYDVQEEFINLRYRLLPYIYSSAWQVSAHSKLMMRALAMDFPHDKAVFNINNEYMFGASILVAPVTDSLYTKTLNGKTVTSFSMKKTQAVYLPKGKGWVDFWSGEWYNGGQHIQSDAAINKMPLFVKAGSILPLGPLQQYVGEVKLDTLEIQIYPGANGQFLLYEDEGDNYNYERQQYSTINFSWNNAHKLLTIGGRKGNYSGMLKNRVFDIVLVKKGTHGRADQSLHHKIAYNGNATAITL